VNAAVPEREPIPPTARKAALAGFVGTFIEYYDYLLFSVLTVYIAPQFFPSADPSVSILLALSVYGVGYIAKPVGALVFGRMGDRVGRRRTLLLTVILMGVTTSLIAVLPTYASIGLLAPALLVILRILQGASSGAELQGSITYVLESAPRSRRAQLTSMVNLGSGLGGATGALTAAVIGLSVSPQTMVAWGWRIPFLVAIPLTILAIVVRKRLEDSPDFQRLVADNRVVKSPIKETFTRHWRILLVVFALVLAYGSTGGLLGWLVPYLTGIRRLDPAPIFLAYAISQAAGNLALVPLMGRLTDRYGPRRAAGGVFVGLFLLMIPVLAVLGSATSPVVIGIAMTVFIGAIAGSGVPIYLLASRLFPVQARFTGSNVGSQLASAIGASMAPLVASALVIAWGTSFAPLVVLGVAAVVGLGTVLLAPRFLADTESPMYGRTREAGSEAGETTVAPA
jgi:MFS transporter, MHS family, proline/betaine transporter